MNDDEWLARLDAALAAHFGRDRPRIDHARRVTDFARRIMAAESAPVRPAVVLAAAVLHDVGIPAAIKKYGKANGPFQEIEGPPIARRILGELGAAPAVVEAVAEIVSQHHTGRLDDPEFNIIWDSDWLVNFPGEILRGDKTATPAQLDRIFRTATGRRLAGELYLEGGHA